MFHITRDRSAGSSIQCLAKITVMVLSRLCSTHTQYGQICCHNTYYIHINGHDRIITVILAKHCTQLLDDGSLVT